MCATGWAAARDRTGEFHEQLLGPDHGAGQVPRLDHVVGACQAHLFILRVPGVTMHWLDEYVTTSRKRGYRTPCPRAEPARVPADARGRQRRVGARYPGGRLWSSGAVRARADDGPGGGWQADGRRGDGRYANS